MSLIREASALSSNRPLNSHAENETGYTNTREKNYLLCPHMESGEKKEEGTNYEQICISPRISYQVINSVLTKHDAMNKKKQKKK